MVGAAQDVTIAPRYTEAVGVAAQPVEARDMADDSIDLLIAHWSELV